ncbi:MAG: hypothetical protein HY321_13825 [Armatimonadetes bacterium]|nr:hypothetical protein [Armatimonadota bacterium]
MLGEPTVLGEITDPEVIREMEARRARYLRNDAVFCQQMRTIYERYRGKVVVIAGEELHVAETPDEAWAWARRHHPDDDGLLVRSSPKEKGWRIYGASRRVVRM